MAPKVIKNLMGYIETKQLLMCKNYFENRLFLLDGEVIFSLG